MWGSFVEIIRAAIFGAAHVAGGSLGAGILLVSAGVRLALLPLTLRLARRGREQQARLAAIKPELDALQRRFADDPGRLVQEIRALHGKHGIQFVSPAGIASLAIQAPLLGGLLSAVRTGLGAKVRFLWVADLARPDALLVLAVLGLVGLAFRVTPTPSSQTGVQTMIVVGSMAATLAFLWSASSAIALSVAAGPLVSVVQAVVMRERRPGR